MTEVTHDESLPTRPLQPLLHDLVSCVAAPALLLADRDGQVRPGGVSGWYAADVRLLDRVEVSVAGSGLDLVRSELRGAAEHATSWVARGLGDPLPDPTVRVDRVRVLRPDGFTDRYVVESVAQEPVRVRLSVRIGSDLAPMAVVKQGGGGEAVPGEPVTGGLRWGSSRAQVTLATEPAAEVSGDVLTWDVTLGRGERISLRLEAAASVAGGFAPGGPAGWGVRVEAVEPGVRRTCERGLADLAGLLLADGDDAFLAAGSPWFLTLFGRDALWAARMLVPFDAGLALSTLRVLARRQGVVDDPATEEQPGKILHEVRPETLDLGAQVLPPVYYGTVDATPLFVCTLADAHAWGADPAQVRALLPAARRCLEWVLAQSAGSGWLRYVDQTGRGLANQGWKDSHDSVQFADGRLAEPPIALSEVQAYAHEAAVRGAALLEAYDEPPVPGLDDWATDLRRRFTDAFWVETPAGGHVAIALDASGAPADSVTSNLGHLLGTGLLAPAAADRVAALLGDERLDSGFGLRTLAADSPRFSRLSYHGGTVWPHDTAIAVGGLAAEGHLDAAATLARGLFRAAEAVDFRLPELYGGDAATEVGHPSAYPAACRPQAWSAAAPLAALVAVTGLRVDGPARVVRHPERTSTALGAFAIRGLRVGAERLDVAVDADGSVRVDAGPGLRVVVG